MANDVKITADNIRNVTNAIARASGTFACHMEMFIKNALGRHRCIARLLGVPDEKGLRDDYIREILQNDVIADGDLQERFEELDHEFRLAIAAGVDVSKGFESLVHAWAAEHQRLTQSCSIAEARVAELTERLKEHAIHDPEVREAVWKMTGGKCFYCEVELIRCAGDEQDRSRCFHIDHIVAKSRGGPDHLSNYVPACERCNISKNAKSFVEFLAWRKAQQAQPQLMVIAGGAA